MVLYNIILLIALWLVCGLWASGRAFAYFQGKYPSLAKIQHGRDRSWSYMWGMSGGPFAVLVSLCDHKGGYGLKFK
jgi:hypothetical protein